MGWLHYQNNPGSKTMTFEVKAAGYFELPRATCKLFKRNYLHPSLTEQEGT